jgi:hypothetical protein
VNEREQPTTTESQVDLPDEVDEHGTFDVYVNGILQEYETDYRLEGRTLAFTRPLTAEVKMTKFQFVRAALGIAGTYTRHDTVDVAHVRDGRKLVATGLRPRSPDRAASEESRAQ